MTTFETIADVMAARSLGLSTGLPQLDRIAPLGPGHLAVLIGASGVGKSRVAKHITNTVDCTNERGVLTVTGGHTTVDALDSSVAFRSPALVVVDPLTTLASRANPNNADEYAMQYPVHPAELGRLAEGLTTIARTQSVPILACHRFTPIRDSVTGEIVSTEAANPLLDQAHVVVVVRVLADPHHVGLEIVRNRLGPVTTLRVPLPPLTEAESDSDGATPFVPAPRSPLS
jgi:hypothetical protein